MLIKKLTKLTLALGVLVSEAAGGDTIQPMGGNTFYIEFTPDPTYADMCATPSRYGSVAQLFNLALDTWQYSLGVYDASCAKCGGSKKFTGNGDGSTTY